MSTFALFRKRPRDLRRAFLPVLAILLADDPVSHVEVRGGVDPDRERELLRMAEEAEHPSDWLAAVLADTPHRVYVVRGVFEDWGSALRRADRLHSHAYWHGETGARLERYSRRGQCAVPDFYGRVIEPFGGNEICATAETPLCQLSERGMAAFLTV